MDEVIHGFAEVALAVEDQDKAVAWFEDLFGIVFNDSWEVPVDSMKVRCATIGDTQFHILASTSHDALIAKYIKERGGGIHHIAFRVSDLDGLVARLRAKGVRLVPDTPRLGRTRKSGEKSRYVFIHPQSAYGILIELIEKKPAINP